MILNRKGVGIIDVLIGVALMALLVGIIATAKNFLTKQTTQMKTDLDDSIDTNLAERMFFKDFAGLDPSFNNISTKDDSGYGFFDYYPDVPANAIRTPIERNAEMSIAKGRTDFYILVQDISAGALLNYEPPSAYDIGPTPDNFNQAASLAYNSVNKNNWVGVQRPGFWTEGRLLLIDTPARIRPVNKSTGNIDMSVLPRSPVFVGTVGLDLKYDSQLSTIVNFTHPETGELLNSPDKFFRTLPSMGGGLPIVRMRAVKLIRYYLEPYEDSRQVGTPARLYKTEFVGGQFTTPFLMADKVDRIIFRRDSVLKRMMYFKLIKTQSKSKAGL